MRSPKDLNFLIYVKFRYYNHPPNRVQFHHVFICHGGCCIPSRSMCMYAFRISARSGVQLFILLIGFILRADVK